MADETRLSAGSIQWPCASDDLTLLRGNPRAPPSTSHLTSQRRPRRSNASRLSVSASSRRTFLPCSMNRVRLGTDTRSHAISRSSSPRTAAGLSRSLRSTGTTRSPVVLCEAVTVVTIAATGALTVHVDPDIAVDPTPAPLASTLAQRYQAPTWHLLTQRLALDLSTTALETLQQTLGPAVLAAMPDAAFADAVLAMVLDATPTPFPDRVRNRLEVQAQHDAVELATTLETRGPSLLELEYLLALRQSATRPARLLSLLRQEHFTVLSAAHYQAIRVALAHNTFQQVDGILGLQQYSATGPARGHAELRPLVADTMSLACARGP